MRPLVRPKVSERQVWLELQGPHGEGWVGTEGPRRRTVTGWEAQGWRDVGKAHSLSSGALLPLGWAGRSDRTHCSWSITWTEEAGPSWGLREPLCQV